MKMKGLKKKNLEKIFMVHMGEFYGNKGIRLMEKNEIDDFMRLLKNLRGGITQIVKRYFKVGIGESRQTTVSSECIYHLSANNLYGGAMQRMMLYELVGIPERREQVMEKINRNPSRWIQSLNTFDKFGYFIECDIETPKQLHDKFNDLPFILFDTEGGMYSDGIKRYAEKNDIMDKMKESNTPKLFCDFVSRRKSLVHYSLL